MNNNHNHNKTIIRLDEQTLYEIIENAVRKYLCETHTSILYHFTPLHNFARITLTDSLETSFNEKEYSNGKNFISLTRNGNFKEGFPHLAWSQYGGYGDTPCVRIQLDGNKLKQLRNTKIKPFDWSYHEIKAEEEGDYPTYVDSENGKEWMLKSTDTMTNSLTQQPMTDQQAHPYSQAEDRLMTNDSEIPNISKYITEITIYIPKDFHPTKEDSKHMKQAKTYCKNKNLKLQVVRL